jgi:Phage Mu protein F like protein
MSLQSLADQHRNAILAREQAAASQITAQWKDAFTRTLARLHWLFSAMSSAEHTGQAVNLAWMYEAQRMQQALSQIHAEMHTFAQAAKTTVAGQVHQAKQAGQADAQVLLKSALPGVSFAPPQAMQALASSLDSGFIATRFAQMPADAVKRAKGTLLAGLANGWGPRQIASRLQYDMSISLRDALRISRTESMVAYRTGNLSIYRANSDVVTGWEWLAEPDACPECLSKNGSVHSLDEEMDDHNNGRCTMLPRTVSYADILQEAA